MAWLTWALGVGIEAVWRLYLDQASITRVGVGPTGPVVRAYNDAAGVTAAFNLNLLARINRELGASIDLETFRHEAIYNAREGRIEMHLVSRIAQCVRIDGIPFSFRAGESIHTENSYKYSIPQFQELAVAAGWTPSRVWADEHQQFSVHELVGP